ncbi:hypothetical protein AVEN_79294-1 [Araneus ventricosus]|uniref:Thyroglobulin type-1 domain-containing protein n=1 Tax=Araneus ventricosus TaxID=182803 RepID=A0A4Y2PXX6_ARAVE|nr:hypothetical protein AVEN_79294-1 [Araneus ventricosus]
MLRGTVFLLVVLVISFAFASAKTACEEQREEALSNAMIGSFTPECEADGTFSKKQCWSSVGRCFCVDPISGKKTTDLDCE